MAFEEGEEDEVTTTSTTTTVSEQVTRTVDSSATATPSAGTPSDSLDRNVDPKNMMSTSNDSEEAETQISSTSEERLTSLNETATLEQNKVDGEGQIFPQENQDNTNLTESGKVQENEVVLQSPPPRYSALKQDPTVADKSEACVEQSHVKTHRRNKSSCGSNKILRVDLLPGLSAEGINSSEKMDNKLSGDTNVTGYGNDSYKVQGPESYCEKAICLDSAYKHYGKGRNKTPVLLGLDMNVDRGTIYGLLGPSGCGKTTLLKCIVGKLKPDDGSVYVFGQPPGTPGCGVPGSKVGYMPQELALFGEFNIAETLRYFSRIFGMSYQKYKERINFLMKFLDLPSRTRQIQNMSGGQQRRASLAVALLHEPELLILDEPTVGVDPLLRTSIWSHLTGLCSPSPMTSTSMLDKDAVNTGLGRTTIVITTHYIEEARQAHRVGMMRFGKLLEEGSPDSLIRRYSKPNLEDVFLELCLRDGDLETAKVREERSKRSSIFNPLNKKKNRTSSKERDSASQISAKLSKIENQADPYSINGHKTDPLLSEENGALQSVVIVPSSTQSSTSKPEQVSGQTNVSHQRHSRKPSSLSTTNHVNNNNSQKSGANNKIISTPSPNKERRICNLSPTKINACMIKTFNRMKKRVGFLIYQFVLPAIQVSLFCLAIGQDPKDLNVAIVNGELSAGKACSNDSFSYKCPMDLPNDTTDHFAMMDAITRGLSKENGGSFSCRYLSFLETSVVSPVYYDSVAEATVAVQNGEAWGVISVGKDFTENLFERIMQSIQGFQFEEADPFGDEGDADLFDLFNKSSVRIRMDVTNQHIAYTLQLKFVEAFEKFAKQMIKSCNLPDELASVPLVFEDPIYGSKELTFTDFMAPGIILTIVHSMALGYSAMIIIIERNEGLLDRTWVAGVTPGEFALAHFLVSLVVNLLQVVVTLVFMINVFQVPAEGSIVWIFLLTMLQGICGTTIGLIISAVCETQQDATQIALGIFYPNLILSGIIWPIESMPVVLRYIAYVLPQTFACEAMRGILLRGWGITYMPVWRGYLVTIAWIVSTYTIFKRMVIKDS